MLSIIFFKLVIIYNLVFNAQKCLHPKKSKILDGSVTAFMIGAFSMFFLSKRKGYHVFKKIC